MKRKHSKKYQEIVKKIGTESYSVEKALIFLQKNCNSNSGNIEITLTLHKMKSNSPANLKISRFTKKKKNIAIIDDILPKELIGNEKIQLIKIEEILKMTENKKQDWGFEDLIASPKYEEKLRSLAKILGKRGLFPSAKNGTLTDNISEAVAKLEREQKIKIDKIGGIHYILGKVDFPKEKLLLNYQILNKEITGLLQAYSLKLGFIKKITLSTNNSPGIRIQSK